MSQRSACQRAGQAAVQSGAPPWRGLTAALRRPRYEVLPVAGMADEVEQHVPTDLPVTVTASPRRGMEPTLALTEALAARRYRAVPHVAARLVVDEAHLSEMLHRLDEAGVRDLFVVGGDGDRPVGDFVDAASLLAEVRRLRADGAGMRVEEVGVAGYPEGHPLVPEAQLDRALLEKQALASYVVTQMCFRPGLVPAWVARARRLGITLPVHVGIAGPVERRKLLRVTGRIGVGDSARFLRKHRHGVARWVLPGGYDPTSLVEGMAADLGAGGPEVSGLHIYTLGDVAATEAWRLRALARLTAGTGGSA